MSGPYFQKQSWPPFAYEGITYDFTHLDEYQVEVEDSGKVTRRIAISFSDHCFTKEPEGGEDPALRYRASTRPVGLFCQERYQHSLRLKELIGEAMEGRQKIWVIESDNFAAIPTVDHLGNRVLYGIIFSLDRVKKMPVDLDMRVRTAYPCDEKAITTFGHVRFAHLVMLRMQSKRPNRRLERNRPRPRLS
jgi:hypothetical protein